MANTGSGSGSSRGFKAMKEQGRADEVRKIAQKGGKNSHKND